MNEYDDQSRWFKSSYSCGACTCVEVRFIAGGVEIRDSKAVTPDCDPAQIPIITVSLPEWIQFLAEVAGVGRPGRTRALAITAGPQCDITLFGAVGDVRLRFSADEWAAFAAGVVDGEFAPWREAA